MTVKQPDRQDPAKDSVKQERMNDEVNEILRRVDSLPTLSDETTDEILGFDNQGLRILNSSD